MENRMGELATLVPFEWVDAEVNVFPKGHTTIATSWPMPTSECALDNCFNHKGANAGSRTDGKCRGPVRFQLDLEGGQA